MLLKAAVEEISADSNAETSLLKMLKRKHGQSFEKPATTKSYDIRRLKTSMPSVYVFAAIVNNLEV